MKRAAVSVTTKDGKRVGFLKGNTYVSNRRKSVHLFRSIGETGSWGIDYDILFNQLPENACIRIIENEEGVIYQIGASVFRKFGSVLHFKEGTVDHYTQVFLPTHYWMQIKQRHG